MAGGKFVTTNIKGESSHPLHYEKHNDQLSEWRSSITSPGAILTMWAQNRGADGHHIKEKGGWREKRCDLRVNRSSRGRSCHIWSSVTPGWSIWCEIRVNRFHIWASIALHGWVSHGVNENLLCHKAPLEKHSHKRQVKKLTRWKLRGESYPSPGKQAQYLSLYLSFIERERP